MHGFSSQTANMGHVLDLQKQLVPSKWRKQKTTTDLVIFSVATTWGFGVQWFFSATAICHFTKKTTLQGINISHFGKRKIIFKSEFWWDMLVPWRLFRNTFFRFSVLNVLSTIQYSSPTYHYQRQCLQEVRRIYYTLSVGSLRSGSPFDQEFPRQLQCPYNTKNKNHTSQSGEQQIYSGTWRYLTWRVVWLCIRTGTS